MRGREGGSSANFRRGARPRRRLWPRALLAGVAACLAVLLLVALRVYSVLPAGTARGPAPAPARPHTLVVYAWRDADPEATNNLRYFVRAGVAAGDAAARFVLALDAGLSGAELPPLPALPPNAQWVRPPRQCWALGTLGWVLFESGAVRVEDYRYFVWVNQEVRGPFLPAWARGKFPWHALLTERLTADVKLVGAFISCELLFVAPGEEPLVHPHVMEPVGATDRAGLDLLRDAGALACEPDWLKARVEGTYMASAAVLEAGLNLDCLMLRYQGVDWRDQDAAWGCNAAASPLFPHLYDGVSLNPFEVLFVPYSHAQVVTDGATAAHAAAYSRWTLPPSELAAWKSRLLVLQGPTGVLTNNWLGVSSRLMLQLRERPRECFDVDLYVGSAPLELGGLNASAAYEHWRREGFRQGRPFQFVC